MHSNSNVAVNVSCFIGNVTFSTSRRWRGGPSLTIFACTIPTEGALPLRFLQGWAAMLLMQLLSVAPARLRMYSLRPFAKTAKDRHHCVGNACNIKSLGHLP